MKIKIQKFGGSSLATTERIEKVAEFIATQHNPETGLVVVVSAMGKKTDELMDLAFQVSANPPKRELDLLLSAGERISMSLLSIALHKRSIPSISFTGSQVGIITDDVHGSARISKILGTRLHESLAAGKVVIVAGFQGVSSLSKDVTTLGRGGTDLTALALGHVLKADIVELFKDVSGLFYADPKLVENPRKVPQVSWDHMKLLSDFGSKLIQARAILIARKYRIPIVVRSSYDFNQPGTLTGDVKPMMESSYFEAMTILSDLRTFEIRCPNFTASADVMGEILRITQEFDGRPAYMKQESAFPAGGTFKGPNDGACVLRAAIPAKLCGAVSACLDAWKGEAAISYSCASDPVSCVTVVGGGFYLAGDRISRLFSALGEDVLQADVRDELIYVFCHARNAKKIYSACHENCFVENGVTV